MMHDAPPRRSPRPFDFEGLYAAAQDPWNFETSAYEQEKYATTLKALGRTHYRSAFEPGCSIGVLTQALAPRCDELLAMDVSRSAAARACSRCAQLPQVTVAAGDFRDVLGTALFDLIVFSEVGYYFSRPELRRISAGLGASLRPGGELLAVHWLGDSPDHVLHGDIVHEDLRCHLGLAWTVGLRRPGYRLDLWRAL